MNKQTILGVLLILISAICFGTMPLFAYKLSLEGVNSPSLVFYRVVFALPFLAVLAKRGGGQLQVDRQTLFKILMLGLPAALTPLFLYSAYRFMATGVVTTVHFSYPVLVVLAGWLFLKTKPSVLTVISLFLTSVGLMLIVDFKNTLGLMDLTGFVLAFASAITFGYYVLYLDFSSLSSMESNKLQFYMCLITSVFILVYCMLTGQFTYPTTIYGWIITIGFSMLITFGAAIPFQLGVRMIGPQNASILSTAEPITSVIIGVMMLNEHIRWIQGVAIGLILISTILVAFSAGRESKAVN